MRGNMENIVTNTFKIRKTDEYEKNIPFNYLAAFPDKSFKIPIVDVFKKGKIFGSGIDFSKIVFMPIGATSYSDALNMGQKIVTEIKKRIRYKTMSSIEENNAILTRDVRGYLYDIFDVFEMMTAAIKSCGYEVGKDIVFMLDANAGKLYRKESDMYYFPGETFKRKEKINSQGNTEEKWQNYIEKEVGCQCEGVEYRTCCDSPAFSMESQCDRELPEFERGVDRAFYPIVSMYEQESDKIFDDLLPETPDTKSVSVLRSSSEMADYYKQLCDRFPIIGISGALAVNDKKGWDILDDSLGDSVVFLDEGAF